MANNSVKYTYPYSYRKRYFKNNSNINNKFSSIPPIVICRRENLINEEEFKIANYFLSLYRLRYGELMVRANSFGCRENIYKGIVSEEWYEKRNKHYSSIIRILSEEGVLKIMMDICVYEYYPDFLKNKIYMVKNFSNYQKLKLALKLIRDFLKKKYSLTN